MQQDLCNQALGAGCDGRRVTSASLIQPAALCARAQTNLLAVADHLGNGTRDSRPLWSPGSECAPF